MGLENEFKKIKLRGGGRLRKREVALVKSRIIKTDCNSNTSVETVRIRKR
jgi:hypothetical protein